MQRHDMYPLSMVLALDRPDGVNIAIPNVIKERLDKALEYYTLEYLALAGDRQDVNGKITVSWTEFFNYLLNCEEAWRAVQHRQD